MGYIASYCKKCDSEISGFAIDGIVCEKCNTYNTGEDVKNSAFNRDYHPAKRKIKEHRLDVIKKILNG